jgi:hypothetical protein
LRPLASGRYGALRVGLVAYWPFEEDASSGDVTAVDWTGRGNDLTSNNTVLSATGKVGSAREFVAANSEYMDRASNSDLQFGDGDWSLSAWVLPASSLNADGRVVAKDQAGGREFELICSTNTSTTNNKFVSTVYHTDGTSILVAGPGISNASFANIWQHFVVTNESGLVTLYLNGAIASGSGSTPTASRVAGKAFAATATPFNVGRRSFTTSQVPLTGVVDELAKWSRALSATDVAALYNNGTGIDLRR